MQRLLRLKIMSEDLVNKRPFAAVNDLIIAALQ
jgi:hypothetical protein